MQDARWFDTGDANSSITSTLPNPDVKIEHGAVCRGNLTLRKKNEAKPQLESKLVDALSEAEEKIIRSPGGVSEVWTISFGRVSEEEEVQRLRAT